MSLGLYCIDYGPDRAPHPSGNETTDRWRGLFPRAQEPSLLELDVLELFERV